MNFVWMSLKNLSPVHSPSLHSSKTHFPTLNGISVLPSCSSLRTSTLGGTHRSLVPTSPGYAHVVPLSALLALAEPRAPSNSLKHTPNYKRLATDCVFPTAPSSLVLASPTICPPISSIPSPKIWQPHKSTSTSFAASVPSSLMTRIDLTLTCSCKHRFSLNLHSRSSRFPLSFLYQFDLVRSCLPHPSHLCLLLLSSP